jgi:hypothetical protein
MLQIQHLDYDPIALRAGHIQRHGTILGTLVADAEESRHQTENTRAAELNNELTILQAEISALNHAAGALRAKSQVRLSVAYTAYMAHCAEDAKADSEAQAQIAPLTARSRELQDQMRNITLPRLSERELNNLAAYSSINAERLRSADKKLPPLETPPLSALGKINASVGLSKLRS